MSYQKYGRVSDLSYETSNNCNQKYIDTEIKTHNIGNAQFSNIYMFLIITCLQLALYPFGIYDVKQK